MTASVEYAAFVGIDWADRQHAVCLVAANGGASIPGVVAQQAEALDDWVGQLRARFGDRPVAICLEQSRGSLI